tara:strand:- start:582 stop:1205 length:624 start_codon:yes stop_codon:yes gene_type:complete
MAFYIFPRAIPQKDCDKYLKYCLKNVKWEDASTIAKGYTDVTNKEMTEEEREKSSHFDYKMRKTDISFITDKDNLMNELVWGFIREANKQYFHYNLDYFQPVQFARYQNGGHYDWHQDANGDTQLSSECRKLSLTMSLTDHTTYDGGYLEFYNGNKPYEHEEHDVAKDVKDQGSVIVFDSRDWHRVTPVTKGVRYSIVCWTVGPHFI